MTENLSPKNALVAKMVDAGLGAKSTLARKNVKDLEAIWAAHESAGNLGPTDEPEAPAATEPEAGSQPEAEEEDLLGEVDAPAEPAEAGSQPDLGADEVAATEVPEGAKVVVVTRGKPRLEEVARVRIGRKHVTLFDDEDNVLAWVPIAGGTVKVVIDD